jgi:hypothetical protein
MRRYYLLFLSLLLWLSAEAQTARVQIIHNSPSPTVDIYANGALLLDDFEFRTATPFIDVPADVEIDIAVALSNSTSVDDALVVFEDIVFASGQTYVVTASGIVGNAAAPFTLIVNDAGREAATDPGQVDISVLHGSPDAPAVDVDAVFIGNLISNLAYGEFTGYLGVAPGVYDLSIRPAGDPTVVATFRADLSGLAGGAATVFASGLLAGDPAFGLFAALPNGDVLELPLTPTARVQIIHNSPNPTVDVYANGALLLDDFEFRTATPFIDVPADVEIDIAVALSNSTSVDDALVVFEDIVFASGQTYVVTASGIVGNAAAPFTLIVNDAGREAATDPGQVDISVLHGSPDAPAVDVDAVFIGNLISNLAYGEFTGYLGVAPGVYDLSIRPAGDPTVVATFRADLSGLAGGAATVFASGLLAGDPAFGLFAALPNGDVLELPLTPTARVQIIHNSPNPTVDVYANGALLLDDFEFRTATPFIDVPADVEIDIAVALSNSTSVDDALVVFEDIIFASGQTYVVTASGIVGNAAAPFTLIVNDAGREAAADPDQVDFFVLHGSPNAPAVDVDVRLLGTLLENVSYGQFSPYFSVGPDVYYLDVRVAGTPAIVATFEADLSGLEGQAITVFASGLIFAQPAFGLFAALPDGTVVELPVREVARLQLIHNSPTGTVDVYVNGELTWDDFEYQTATEFDFVPAGVALDIAIAPGNSTSVADAVATFPGVEFENSNTYVVIAHGIAGNADTPLTLTVLNGRERTENPDGFELAIFHGVTDAPAVDVDARDVGNVVENLAYGEFTPYLSLDPIEYALEVRPTGSDDLVATFLVPGEGAEGIVGVVFASGFLGQEPPFELLVALPDGFVVSLPTITRVQVIHNSPDPAVDVYINDGLAIPNFEFRTATPFIDLPTREPLNIAVAPAGSQSSADAVANFNGVVLEDGKFYIVMATGVVGSSTTPFDLAIFDGARVRAASGEGVDLLLYHGAPDAPAVDVRLQDGGPVLFGNTAYGEFNGYLNVPAAAYVIDITPAGNPTVVARYAADVSGLNGGAATVFASGFLAQSPGFEVWVALADGTTFPLSVVSSTGDVESLISDFLIAPNPLSNEATVQYTLSETAPVTMNIYNSRGALVNSRYLGVLSAGVYIETLDAGRLANGLYSYSLVTSKGVMTKRFLVVK